MKSRSVTAVKAGLILRFSDVSRHINVQGKYKGTLASKTIMSKLYSLVGVDTVKVMGNN